MSDLSELFCVMKGETTDIHVLEGQPQKWETLRWSDEFGNSIAPFFTSRESGRRFLGAINDWELKRYPVSFIVAIILANIHQETSFYTIDPRDTERFKALNQFQFLTELIFRTHPFGSEAQDPISGASGHYPNRGLARSRAQPAA
jgi:hypothetical protein